MDGEYDWTRHDFRVGEAVNVLHIDDEYPGIQIWFHATVVKVHHDEDGEERAVTIHWTGFGEDKDKKYVEADWVDRRLFALPQTRVKEVRCWVKLVGGALPKWPAVVYITHSTTEEGIANIRLENMVCQPPFVLLCDLVLTSVCSGYPMPQDVRASLRQQRCITQAQKL